MTSPIIVSIIASAITITLYYASGRIENKFGRGAAQLSSVILGVVISGGLSSDNMVASDAGTYFFFIVVAVAVIAKIFGKKANSKA